MQKRKAVVLLAVLVVTVILSLSAYQSTETVLAELKAATNSHNAVQARLFAESGIHYAAMMLSTPDNVTNLLNDNPYHNPDKFRDVAVSSEEGSQVAGKFRLIAPLDPDDASSGEPFRSGVTDEGGKLNLNTLMKVDPTGQTLIDALLKLPGMTDEIANAIADWIDADHTPRSGGGAENAAYSELGYRCKNGPLDSVEELLYVKGVTRDLLYGPDLNRNNIKDAGEAESDSNGNRGWIHYLTVYSHESNRDVEGTQLAFINNSDLLTLYGTLFPVVGEDLAKFVVLYRQYGSAAATGKTQSFGGSLSALMGGGKKTQSAGTVPGDLSAYQINPGRSPVQKIKSFFDLTDAWVSVKSSDPKKPATLYASPLNDEGKRRELLPKLYQTASLSAEADIPGRINVNTAPLEVLLGIPDLSEAEAKTIVAARPKFSATDQGGAMFQSPTWLLTEARLNVATLRKIEKYVTTRAQVFRVQSEGSFENGTGPRSRVEAVIDINNGRPRFLLYRDLTELGRIPK